MRFQYERISFLLFIFIAAISICSASSCQLPASSSAENTPPKCGSVGKCETAQTPPKPPLGTQKPANNDSDSDKKTRKDLTLDEVLTKLTASNKTLESYHAKIKYTFIQDPELINTVTIRKGNIYYLKGKKTSDLLIEFTHQKQDDADEEKHLEKYIFDGVYLKILDYQNKTVNIYQKAEKDKPRDAFEFISTEFPMVGFTDPQLLKRQFDISLAPRTKKIPATVIPIKLDVKRGSIYEKEYKTIDFWIDKKTFLPARLATISTEGDIKDFMFTDTAINKKLKKAVFKVETPKDFSETITPLEKIDSKSEPEKKRQ